jgi:hypothetical protein
MRFLMLVRMTPESAAPYEHGEMPSETDIASMMSYNQKLVDAHAILSADGLHPTSQGAIISWETGSPIVTDGPFAEAKDVIGGYWVVQADSPEAMLELARQCPMSDGDVLELRPIFEMADFQAAIASS